MRIAAMREDCGISVAEMAKKLSVTESEYVEYESGMRDFQISFLCEAADVLGIDVLDLMGGTSPTVSTCTIVKKGQGFAVNRNEAYGYKHLAFPFRNRKIEPFLVTVEPSDSLPHLNSHAGQEYDYMLSGSMKLHLGDMEYLLSEGDCAYFDSSVPHALEAVGDTAVNFLAIVIK